MSVLTVGNFDGVHVGHRAIFTDMAREASSSNTDAVVFTFVPHPRTVLYPERSPDLLTTYSERRERVTEFFKSLSVKLKIFEQPFGREFSSLTPEKFLDQIAEQFSPTALLIGHDFQFGRDRAGSQLTLKQWCESNGVTLTTVAPKQEGGAVVSSSRIRKALEAANLAEARTLLGYFFAYEGVVVHGEGRGRKLGIPTANVKIEPKLILPHGVYVIRLNGREGVANFGVRPTFGLEGALGLECHLFDFVGDLYGRRVSVEVLEKIRNEQRFASPDELKAAIARDLTRARQVHASLRST